MFFFECLRTCFQHDRQLSWRTSPTESNAPYSFWFRPYNKKNSFKILTIIIDRVPCKTISGVLLDYLPKAIRKLLFLMHLTETTLAKDNICLSKTVLTVKKPKSHKWIPVIWTDLILNVYVGRKERKIACLFVYLSEKISKINLFRNHVMESSKLIQNSKTFVKNIFIRVSV